jgi:hypothetical protein
MTQDEILRRVSEEGVRACHKHPVFPRDIIHAAAIVSEESGELTRAVNNFVHHRGDSEEIKLEAVQVIVTAMRFLKNHC